MPKIAGTLLITEKNELVLHRRDNKPGIASPGKLSLFGGHMEGQESPREAAIRELQEEISLDVSQLSLEHVCDFSDANKDYFMFKTMVPTSDFEVYEGVGSEVYAIEEALARDDLADAARTTIIKLLEGEN